MDQIRFLLPEIVLILMSFALLFNSIIDQKDKRITNKILLIIGSIVSISLLLTANPEGLYLNNTFENNSLTGKIKVLLVSGTLLSLLLVSNSKTKQFKEFFNEYCFLLVLSLVGGMIVVSSREFLTLIIAFEILSIPIYLISAMGPDSSKSIEAATKLFFFGTLSTVFMIFSAVLFYSLSGSTYFVDILWESKDVIVILSTIFILITICFKCALYPLHFWVSDTYESAPMNILPFLSTIPKIAIIGFLFFFFQNLYSAQVNFQVINIISILITVSIIFGSVLSIKQDKLFRLLAYSGIPHAGIMLIFVIIPLPITSEFLVLYFAFYIFSNVGLFICLNSLPKVDKDFLVNDLKGLYKSSPFISITLTSFLLSLAGVPLFAGFWGKFNVAIISFKSFGFFLPVVILISAGISFYYYIRIIKAIFDDKAINQTLDFKTNTINKILILICLGLTIALGLNPNLLTKIL
ncbi:NADH-quinone oxidoreductase subunit N [bacterium]|jgi:NADH-quinone oxidoreductase subunit N|nr:NADH-quinone oxidoreductase subunit N [bacterium]